MSRNSSRPADVEQLKQESDAQEAISANETVTDSHFSVPSHLSSGTITRHFNVDFSGSLAEFADSPSLCSWSPTELSIFQSRTRYVSWLQKKGKLNLNHNLTLFCTHTGAQLHQVRFPSGEPELGDSE
jgi:hypothetical protein